MVDVISFQEAIEATKGEARTLLIGNGFSAQYFNYATLLAEAKLEEGTPIRAVFDALDTVDFEAVVRALENASIVGKAYGNEEHSLALKADAQKVRAALVTAVNSTHPAHRENLDVKYESSATFLGHFVKVFTLNYDLLLYWVNLEKTKLNDGFGMGRKLEDGCFCGPFVERAYCDIYNLHGGLHLFQLETGAVMKAVNAGDGVIATITQIILDKQQLPLYVAEGTSKAKMRKINSVGYLRHCFDKLKENTASVFVFGHSADDNDAHIYRALFSSDAKHVFFGVYKPNQETLKHLDEQLAKHQNIGSKNIKYSFYDAESAQVWDGDEAFLRS